MTDMFADIQDFHRKFELIYNGPPRNLPKDVQNFRTRFLREELDEYILAVDSLRSIQSLAAPDSSLARKLAEEALDSLVDLVYVALGTAYLHGFDFNEAWRRVHQANMQKVRAQAASESKRGSTHDVVKPEGWQAPSHAELVKHFQNTWE